MNRWLTLAGIFVLVLGLTGSVGAEPVKAERAIPLFLKVITYDANFKAEEIDAVNLVVVFERKNLTSYEQLRAAEAFMEKHDDLRVSGKVVRITPLPWNKLESELKHLSDTEYNMLLVTSLDDEQVEVVIRVAADQDLRTFTLDSGNVERGLTVGVRQVKKKALIMVNLDQARKEGSKFSAHLLKMCEVYGDKK